MNNIRIAAFLATALAVSKCSWSQSTVDTVRLNDVTVTAARYNDTNRLLDSTVALHYKHARLGDLLSSFGGVSVRRYGPGGAATFAPRGYSPQQVAVTWNGVYITNPMLAQTDLSLVPVFLFNDAKLRLEPNTLAGAPAGAVQLTDNVTQQGFRVTSHHSVSSLQNFTNALRVQLGNARLKFHAAAVHEHHQNTFDYRNTAMFESPVVKHTHAQNKGLGGTTGLQLTHRRHTFHTGGFYYRANRELPPTMLQLSNLDEQADANAAAFIRYRFQSAFDITADITTAYHTIDFYESATGTNYHSQSNVHGASLRVERDLRVATFFARLHTQVMQANVEPNVYSGAEYRHGLQTGLVKTIERLRTTIKADGLQQTRESELLPFNYTVSVTNDPVNAMRIVLTHARLSRLPGLNDRFWQPGGVPHLAPELAYRNSVKLSSTRPFGKQDLITTNSGTRLIVECEVYYDWVDNWIQWLPAGALWSPQNVKTVVLYGVVPHASLHWQRHKIAAVLSVRYNLNRAITKLSFATNDASVGKQLMYVPQHIFHTHTSIRYKKLSAFASVNYTGTRFTAADHVAFLDPYTTLDAGVAQRLDVKQIGITLAATVENVTNTVYQTVAWKPMPPRVFLFSLQIQFNHIPNSSTKP